MPKVRASSGSDGNELPTFNRPLMISSARCRTSCSRKRTRCGFIEPLGFRSSTYRTPPSILTMWRVGKYPSLLYCASELISCVLGRIRCQSQSSALLPHSFRCKPLRRSCRAALSSLVRLPEELQFCRPLLSFGPMMRLLPRQVVGCAWGCSAVARRRRSIPTLATRTSILPAPMFFTNAWSTSIRTAAYSTSWRRNSPPTAMAASGRSSFAPVCCGTMALPSRRRMSSTHCAMF